MSLLTVILAAHNPHPGRLRRTLRGLRDQTLPVSKWELLVIDNASTPSIDISGYSADAPLDLRVISEPRPGLSHARRRGFLEARGELIVMVDDDNVLAPDYLVQTIALFQTHPQVGALGGPSRPEFETPPSPWQTEFLGLLALRDLGPHSITGGLRAPGAPSDSYPLHAPIGAGMALRRSAAQAWLDHADPNALTDRKGNELTSGGDNDIVIHVLRAGWDVAYFPELVLTHLIPAARLAPAYLARLNRGIQKSWMQVLLRHDLCNWPPIPRSSVPLRQLKAWFTHRAWSGPAARIRWQGACGHFEGRTR
ncbi:MAG: glycosyltransferase [Opitutaceae bacterium]|nr:glycosyltransferase [Opitutaceae bacterium]